jgi:hypothetical protein
MAILIDPPQWPAHGRRWSHLISDTSVRELHAFAAALGVPERGFEGDHYDVPEERYVRAVRAGAIPVSTRELLRRLHASGLRRAKRRGERVVASRWDEFAGHRVDSVLSAKPPLGPVERVQLALLHGGHLLVVDDGEGFALIGVDVHAESVRAADLPALASRLAATLLGPGEGEGSFRQVGYLRRVCRGRSLPAGVEVVLRRLDDGPHAVDPRELRPPGTSDRPAFAASAPAASAPVAPVLGDGEVLRWVPVRRAVALLPVDVAPVALSEHHRVRPPEPEEPGPVNPEGR